MKKSPHRKQYKIMAIDPDLQPYYSDVALRMQRHADVRQLLLGTKADLSSFAYGYMSYGFLRTESGWVFREWAPGADEIHLIGDFNDWNRTSHSLKKIENGVWQIEIDGENALRHDQSVKGLNTNVEAVTYIMPRIQTTRDLVSRRMSPAARRLCTKRFLHD